MAHLTLDHQDPLKSFREEFCLSAPLYFAGHSLGLRPKQTEQLIQEELTAWSSMGVQGHFKATPPWLSYHEVVSSSLAKLAGAKEEEVVAMNTLTVNLHLMLVSFYRPTSKRYKILIENNTFPSDKYAVDSHARFHGFDPQKAIIELTPEKDTITVAPEHILETIEKHKDTLALVMLGNCNYLSGQYFDIEAITQKAKSVGAMVGFNLAHGMGNLKLKLHQWQVDFAVWCSYKYLNSGPGGIAGAFVHSHHHHDPNIPRFEGWWGHNKQNRFAMKPVFEPIPSAEAWQLSNPPIFQLAALRASLDIFDRATIDALVTKRNQLTGYLEKLLQQKCSSQCTIITPQHHRGAMLCVRFHHARQNIEQTLQDQGIVVDFRKPDIIRMTPAPLYNSFSDVAQLAEAIHDAGQ